MKLSTSTLVLALLVLQAALIAPPAESRAIELPAELVDAHCGPLTVPGGTVKGTLVTIGQKQICTYMGIRYATAERFADPGPPNPWAGQVGSTAGPECPQANEGASTSEDCLYLNVWQPAGQSNATLPVMVWIHGGAFIEGSGSVPLYWGAFTAAAHNVVVVSLNYRLGALGFLAGTAGLTGNYGLKDQQYALQWVQSQIGKFGGDKGKVTIYGESAGAMSVGLHTTAVPSSQGLFRAAIMESNPLGAPYRKHESSSITNPVYQEGQAFRKGVGCSSHIFHPSKTLDCLREVSVAEILSQQQKQSKSETGPAAHGLESVVAWAPYIDGKFVTAQPVDEFNKGSQNVPVLLGTNKNEGDLFIYSLPALSDDGYECIVDILFGADTAKSVLALPSYEKTGSDNRGPASQLVTDYAFTCANRHAAAGAGNSPGVWAYQFDHVPSYNVWGQGAPECTQAVCHGAEITFVFNSAGQQDAGPPFTGDELALSLLMNSYWAAFATSLDPNTGAVAGAPAWPAFTSSAANRLHLVTPTSDIDTVTDLGANCKFWDSVGYLGDRHGVTQAALFCAAHPPK